MVGRALAGTLLLVVGAAVFALLIGRASAAPDFAHVIAPDLPYMPGNPTPETCAVRSTAYILGQSAFCALQDDEGGEIKLELTVDRGLVTRLYLSSVDIALGDLIAIYGTPASIREWSVGFTVCWTDAVRAVGIQRGPVTPRSAVISLALGDGLC